MKTEIIRQPGGDYLGVCEYAIVHDGKLIALFNHYRPDDIEQLFHKAAAAVMRSRQELGAQVYNKNGELK